MFSHVGFKALVILSLFSSSYFLLAHTTHPKNLSGIIFANNTYAYQGNGKNFKKTIQETLPPGTEFNVIEQRSHWIKVQFADQSQAWLEKDFVKIIN